ncbi:EAL domain-containing protein [Catenovulum sediminis]|uniref:EAL domain-containing protein n=1 Tax=Catenovulum sediminis TaxID=1740262 RepID=UPI00117F88A6|nr:EAL domain-containing protein [Catenovulum sediminis]
MRITAKGQVYDFKHPFPSTAFATLFIIIFTFCLNIFSAASYAKEKIEILSIHSYHENYHWTKTQYQAFQQALANEISDLDLQHSSEYLNTKKINPKDSFTAQVIEYLQNKYAKTRPDLIYITDDYAAKVILTANLPFMADIPVIFSGVENTHLMQIITHTQTTGVFETPQITQSVALLQNASPDSREILFIGDASMTDKVNHQTIDEYNQQNKQNIKLIHLSANTIEELLNKLAQYKNIPAIVGSIGALKNEDGLLLDIQAVVNILSETIPVIVFNGDFVPGVLAGYEVGSLYGQFAAKLAATVLLSSANTPLPSPKTPNKQLIIDFEKAKALKLDVNHPKFKHAKLYNKPQSFMTRNKEILYRLMTALGALFFILSVVTIFALRNRNATIAQQYTDTLTKLPNRLKLTEDLKIFADCSLILLDVNNFRNVNSFYGGDIADQLLCELSIWLSSKIESGNILYRISGDNFAILNLRQNELDYLQKSIGLLIEQTEQHEFLASSVNINVSLTAGISDNQQKEKIAQAHSALRYAKKAGLPLSSHKPMMQEQDKKRQNIEWNKKLRQALSEDRITAFFQPIICNKTGEIASYESLVRLLESDGKVISPYFFLEIAKQSRLYHKLTAAVFKRAIELVAQYKIHVSVNVSVYDINSPHLQEILLQLRQRQLAGYFCFEITETEGIENHKGMSHFIEELQISGCQVAIDDFGTGYSNFSHILDLQANKLKIDGSLIQRLLTDNKAELVVKTIVESAKTMGMETVAEFVDSAELQAKVKQLGIDYSQGFYFSPPVQGILPAQCFTELAS